jgi:ubiquinol-cytochrome c reductase iron-sulfur subunit
VVWSEVVVSSQHPADPGTELQARDQRPAVLERFDNPGLHPHRNRRADVEPRAARRAQAQVLFLFAVSSLASIAAVIGYFALPLDDTVASVRVSTLVLGLGLGLGMLGFGLAAVHWGKVLMSNVERVDERHEMRSSDETRAVAVQYLKDGSGESGLARRPLLKGAVVGALALAPLPFVVPLVGNLGGDWDVSKLRHTAWRAGRRLAIDPTDVPIRASDVTIGSIFSVMPQGLPDEPHYLEEKAKAVVILVRLDPRELKEPEDRAGWSYDGIVAYSKVCTHVGCPVALYEQQTHHLLCPCHQSTFDVADQAKVVFGPAKRPLPQLPITVDDEGYLVAQGDFTEPVGPSFWERLK